MNLKNKQPILCCSYPKSGRSWFRFILANYLNEVYKLNLTIDFNNLFTILPNGGRDPHRGIPAYEYHDNTEVPLILFDHSLYSPQYSQVPVIFIIRNIHDTLVSNFFQDTYRIRCFSGNIHEYIRSENGIQRLVHYLNTWSTGLKQTNHAILSYEMMHESLRDSISDVISTILNIEVDIPSLQKAIDLSNFEKMKKIEVESGFPNANINVDTSDSKTLRAREGKVGNYHKYLNEDDIKYLHIKSKELMNHASLELLETYCK